MGAHPTTSNERYNVNKKHRGSDCKQSLRAVRDHHRRRPQVVEMDTDPDTPETLPPSYRLQPGLILTEESPFLDLPRRDVAWQDNIPGYAGRMTETGCFISY
jgi:hypothetical protein